MNNFKKYLPWTIRIIIAFLFLLSAVAKLWHANPMVALGSFEAKQLLPMGFSNEVAPYFSRFLIGAEFAIGLAILFPYYLKRFVIPVSILLLAIFCGQLSYDISQNGMDGGNCGCFGELIKMTPFEALLKNLFAIGLLVWLYKLLPSPGNRKNFATLIIFYLVFALGLFAAFPIQLSKINSDAPVNSTVNDDFLNPEPIPGLDVVPSMNSSEKSAVKAGGKVVLDEKGKEKEPEIKEPKKPKGPKKVTSQFSAFTSYIPPAIKIDEGKKILCLFAPGCGHCQETAKELTQMRAKDPNFPPVHIVFMDEGPELIPEFFEKAGRSYSYSVASVADFWKIIDFSRDTPGVVYLWNGNVRYFSDGINEKAFDKAKFKKELDKTE